MEDDARGRHAAFRRKNPAGNNWHRHFTVVNAVLPGGTPVKRLVRLETDKTTGGQKPGRIVASPVDIFQYIDEVHKSVGHKKVAATFAAAAEKFWNITREHIEVYISLSLVRYKLRMMGVDIDDPT